MDYSHLGLCSHTMMGLLIIVEVVVVSFVVAISIKVKWYRLDGKVVVKVQSL